MAGIKIQAIYFTSEGAQITYVEERDVHTASGIIGSRSIDIPHAVIPDTMYADLTDSVQQILDHALIIQRQPVDEFRADR